MAMPAKVFRAGHRARRLLRLRHGRFARDQPGRPGNKLTGSALGALTYPVATQIANHLKAVGGKFKGDEVVLVMAGGNDALFQLGALSAAATAAGTTAGRPTCQPGQRNWRPAPPIRHRCCRHYAAVRPEAAQAAPPRRITLAAIGAAAVQPATRVWWPPCTR
jgi:hypothetical protein